MKTQALLKAATALTFAILLEIGTALPTEQIIRARAQLPLAADCNKYESAPNNITYDFFVSWEHLDAKNGLNAAITARRDGNDTPFLSEPKVDADFDMIFVGFTVLEGKVQSPSQAQYSVWQHMMGSVDNPRLGGFFPIDLGAPAAPNVVEDSPPSEIQLEVKRGLDVGTAIIKIADCTPP